MRRDEVQLFPIFNPMPEEPRHHARLAGATFAGVSVSPATVLAEHAAAIMLSGALGGGRDNRLVTHRSGFH
jgi:hypothetical protein